LDESFNGGGAQELGMNIRRAKRDRWIYGVCGGIAHHVGWNSNVVRAVVVLLAILIPGVSVIPAVLIYVLLGYLLPETEEF
jgi:phage shock protein C